MIIKVCYTALTFSTFANFDWVAVLRFKKKKKISITLWERGRLARFWKYIHPETRVGRFRSMCQRHWWVFSITFLMESSQSHLWDSIIIRWNTFYLFGLLFIIDLVVSGLRCGTGPLTPSRGLLHCGTWILQLAHRLHSICTLHQLQRAGWFFAELWCLSFSIRDQIHVPLLYSSDS